MVPKQSSETFKPLFPKSLYRMTNLLSRFKQKLSRMLSTRLGKVLYGLRIEIAPAALML
jgi:type II secretory pathway component PulL